MDAPQLNHVTCPDASGGHRMAYWAWGDPGAGRTIVCVHGLARQGRDFDVLAQSIVEAMAPVRVVCPDVVGRGRSDWLQDPQGYVIPTYVADMLALLAHLHAQAPITELSWVGTSMGGLIGLGIASTPGLPLPVPMKRLVLNDVGPVIQWQALQRIGTYLGQVGRFESVQQAADAMLLISRSFGPHTPQQWLALSQAMVREHPEGGFTLHYDPSIAVPFRSLSETSAAEGQAALWAAYDAVQAHTLVLRGAQSDLLSRETAQAMAERGPRARLVEFEGVGHAPTLIAPDQRKAVVDFLCGP